MNRKNLFSKTILDRGRKYYSDGAVEDIDISDKLITAAVGGSEDYEVEITLSNGEIEDMYCSCPYAADGEYCKHMAAVLYKWSEGKSSPKSDTNNDDILFKPAHTAKSRAERHTAVERLIADADEYLIYSFLADALTDNETLCLQFYNTINRQSIKVDLKIYFKQIDSIVRRYSGKDDFIDYYKTDDFIAELEEVIDNGVQPMIDHNYMSAFEITNYIFSAVSKVNIDDSNGGIVIICNDIYDLWTGIIEAAAQGDKQKIFEWFTSHAYGTYTDIFEEYIANIITNEFKEKEFEKDKLDLFKNMIDRSEQLDSDWDRNYNAEKWAVRYIDMLADINSSDEQLEKVFQEYRKYNDIRKMYIDSCLQKKEYDKAISLLDEGISEKENYMGLVSHYSRTKKDIYLLMGNKDAYIEQLWTLVLEHAVGNMELYKELKSQYSESEWAEQREKIFKMPPKYTDISVYYNEEKLYDRLLECVMKSSGFYMLKRYETVLRKDHPEQILEKYKDELNKMSVISSDRKQYSYMVSVMREMKKISGGTKVVEQIVEEWTNKYRKRPAMMDELNKL